MNKLWVKRAPRLPLKTPQQALVMASIIEKEAGKNATERARIAGVFYNRLRKGMPLQSDPTVVYALTKGAFRLRRGLTRRDLAVASPYNTYVHDGLPPKPICRPSLASIKAALHPESNNYLYFVANGKGGNVFAKTMFHQVKNIQRRSRYDYGKKS
ncbi:MAG: endolytic transglycosylase MltG [Alphaproteobacteria bacterium]|nr:endolytic transglycosylase MltG [Alphaproteobacteria bacterium]